MAKEEMSLRDQIRSKTLGAKREFASELVETEDMTFEVRQPTVGERGRIYQKALPDKMSQSDSEEGMAKELMSRVDFSQLQIWAVIKCTYVPDTDEKVFESSDFESLSNLPAGTFLDDLATAAMKLLNVKPKEDAKN